MQYREKIKSGADLRYSECSSMIATPARRDVRVNYTI